MFVNRVRAVAADAQTIKHRDPHRSQKVSVRRAADLCFTEIEIEISGNRARLFKQFDNGGRAFHRRTIDTA